MHEGHESPLIAGTLVKVSGPVSYAVRLDDGRDHQDQIRFRYSDNEQEFTDLVDELEIPTPEETVTQPVATPPTQLQAPSLPPSPRYPCRERHQPSRYQDYVQS